MTSYWRLKGELLYPKYREDFTRSRFSENENEINETLQFSDYVVGMTNYFNEMFRQKIDNSTNIILSIANSNYKLQI